MDDSVSDLDFLNSSDKVNPVRTVGAVETASPCASAETSAPGSGSHTLQASHVGSAAGAQGGAGASDNASENSLAMSDQTPLCCEVALGGGRVALVDKNDFDRVSAVKWHAVKATGRRHVWYAQDHLGNRLHVFLFGKKKGYVVDHKDGDGLNCLRSNLRWATYSQNRQNAPARKNNSTGFKGVRTTSSGRFSASIGVAKKLKYLGTYDNAVDAAIAYDLAAIRFFGEFARTNVIL